MSYIDDYYSYRELKDPNAEEALLFFLSEVGELCENYLHMTYPDKKTRRTIHSMVTLGKKADTVVSEKGGWKRNNERAEGYRPINGEIGDCLMMLDRFSQALIQQSPEQCLRDKMKAKGHNPEE